MTEWHSVHLPFEYRLGEVSLFRVHVPLEVRSIDPVSEPQLADALLPPDDDLPPASEGFCVRALPVAGTPPVFSRAGAYLCYVASRYRRCFIDLGQSFEQYERKFSSKTRSTIRRKVKRYAEQCSGDIRWKAYRDPGEMREFFALAREVSRKTYQERLLDAGLPATEEFKQTMERLAARDEVRAYVLFSGEQAVSYLYCPAVDGIVTYAYLGYDPAFARLSVGTVLQWLAVESLFNERRFRYFDFTEGESEHKRLFATHEVPCVNVFFLRRSLRNLLLIRSHHALDELSRLTGVALERLRLKARVKRLLRTRGI